MSISKTVNGSSFNLPTNGETFWGTEVTNWMVEVSDSTLQLSGGSFPITDEVDFSNIGDYGLVVEYVKSSSANPSSTGIVRLANGDGIGFRDSGNTADYLLTPSTDGLLQYGGVDLVDVSAAQTLTNKTLTSPAINSATITGGTISGVTISSIDGATITNSSLDSATSATVDHDVTVNYVANEHIDHSSVSITAGTGLSGGGDLTATRQLDVDINSLTEDTTPDALADYVMTYDASGTAIKKVLLNNMPATGTGQANIGQNVGTGGVGPYKGKSGITLQFKNINAGSSKISVTDDITYDEIDIDVVEGNLVHDNISGTGANTHAQIDTHIGTSSIHFTEASIDHNNILNVGSNSHVQIDTHIASTSNPHSVNKSQVGLGSVENIKSEYNKSVDPTVSDDNTLGYTEGSLWVNTASDIAFICVDNATGAAVWWEVTVQTVGEANTGFNTGVGGIGIYKTKTGTQLEFKNLNIGSSKVSLTDDVANDEIDIDIVEANINHDALANFTANEHIDHSGIGITAGVGLSGGGDLTVSRTLNLDVNSLTLESTIDTSNDTVAIYDASVGAMRKTTADKLGEQVTGSNIGIGGVGLYKTKVGSSLQFKNINAASSKVTVSDDVANNEVDIDLGTVNVNDLNDVFNSSPADKHVLVYDGITDNRYENRLLVKTDISDADWISDITSESIGDLSDVTLTSLGSNEVLVSSGSTFVNKTFAEANLASADHNHRSIKDQAVIATTANLPVTASGSGVGKTLTGTDQPTISAIDGITPVTTDRILVKDQTNAVDNGIYTVTDEGSDEVFKNIRVTVNNATLSNFEGNYFAVGNGYENHYFWFSVDGGTTDPAPGGYAQGWKIQLFTGDTVSDIAQAISTRLQFSTMSYDTNPSNDYSTFATSEPDYVAPDKVEGHFRNRPDLGEGSSGVHVIYNVDVAGSALTFTTLEAAASAVYWELTRATDMDTDAETYGGMFVGVSRGTANAGTIWVLDSTPTFSNGRYDIDADDLDFTQISFGGESNTASNVGVAGVGLFKQKTTANLEFKNINAGSSKISITDDTGNSEVDIDVVEGNVVHQNLSGAGTNTHAQIDSHIADSTIHFTEASIDHSNILNVGTNTHAQIDSHIADSTIHFTKSSINIDDLGDVVITTPADNEVLAYDTTSGNFINQTANEAGLSETGHLHAASDITSGTFADARIAESNVTQHEAAIDHTAIQNIGTNTHAQIDTHIADSTIHFTQAAINITESQISDLQSYLLDITGEVINDLSDVVITTPADNEVLAYNTGTSKWINQTPAEAGLSAVGHTHVEADISDLGTTIVLDSDIGSTVQGYDAGLASIAGLTTAADKMIYTTGSDTYAVTDLTSFARSILDDADEATFKATVNLEIGTDVQAYDANILTLKNNLNASVAPTTTDDSGSGYAVGSRWIDTTADKEYVCLDATSTAAVWTETTQAGSSPALNDVTDVTITTLGTDELLFTQDGSTWINQTLAEAGISAVGHTHAASDVTSGTFADARIATSNVTQHEGSITHQNLSGAGTNTHAQIDSHISSTTVHVNKQQDTVQTTDATQTTLVTYAVPSNTIKHLYAVVKGRESATGDAICKRLEIIVNNISGTAGILGSVSSYVAYETGASTWDIAASVSSGNLLIKVTGEAAHTIDWEGDTEIR